MTAYTFPQALAIVRRELDTQSALATVEGIMTGMHVPFLLGTQGIGKTRIARDEAARRKLDCLIINCGELSDTTELAGMLIPAMTRSVGRIPVLTYGLQDLAARACAEGVLLLLDDVDKAPPQLQGAMLSIIGSRHFRSYPLHPSTLLMCAGNQVDDDMYANDISESLRTRVTIVEMIPDVKAFCEWGAETEVIHPAILGFLQWKPLLLHQKKTGVARFPTPRGWEEASFDLYRNDNPHEDILGNGTKNAWKILVELRCGGEVANDFWAWHEVVKNVDVAGILSTGKSASAAPATSEDAVMTQYAEVFAVVSTLNLKGVKKAHYGLSTFVDHLSPEMRVAMTIQLNKPAQRDIRDLHPTVASLLMRDIAEAAPSP